jgi:hypothetical protein
MEIIDIVRQLAVAVRTRKEAQDQLYHLFLTQSIGQQETVKGYGALARLIRQGYFVTILTSNMDTALETALEQEGLYPSKYTVLIVGQDENDKILDALEVSHGEIYIVKLPFSQSQTGLVSFPSELSSDIQSSLQRYFNQNIVIVGYIDQEEEAKAALQFHRKGGIYYVRQAAPDHNDIIVKCITNQNKHPEDFIITTTYGEFNAFFCMLETLINNGFDRVKPIPDERRPLTEYRGMRSPDRPTVKLPPVEDENVESQSGPQQSKLPVKQHAHSTVFISYSHKDAEWLERLQVHLRPLERKGILDIWADTKIIAGMQWREEIQNAIESSTVAVVLVSADFLASDFIEEHELPKILSRAKTGGTTILPVIVSPCLFVGSGIDVFKSINSPDSPLIEMLPAERERTLVELARVISKKLTEEGS